jgi:hypothetical protein
MMVDRWCVAKGLGWKLFSSVAIVAHCWRDHHRAVYDVMLELFGKDLADKHAKTLIALCMAGRWGSYHKTAERLVFAGEDMLSIVIPRGLPRARGVREPGAGAGALAAAPLPVLDGAAPPPPAALAPTSTVDCPRLQESEAYREKMGKYRTMAVTVTPQPLWWRVLELHFLAAGPLNHNLLALQKILPVKGSLGVMICSKAQSIFAEFYALYASVGWRIKVVERCPPEFQDSAMCLGVSLILLHAAGYHRRFIMKIERFPMLLCWIVFTRADVDCKHRRRVCNLLLDTSDDALEVNAWKIKTVYRPDIELAANNGMCSPSFVLSVLGDRFSGLCRCATQRRPLFSGKGSY